MAPKSFPIRSIFFLAFFFSLLGSAAAQNEHGILVRDALIRINPDESSAQLGTSPRGAEVAILERSRDWIKVLAPAGPERDVTGWILDKGVVRSNTPNGDKIIFGEAEDSEDQASRPHGRRGAAQDAMRLYSKMNEFFPKSPLAGEALYRAADIQWQMQYSDVMSLASARQQDPDARPKIDEDAMHEVMKKFPHSKWADLAAYHLIDNQLCGDWQGQSKCPQHESEIYEKYAREHPASLKAPEALYKAASRQGALIEIYKSENQPSRSDSARSKAVALTAQIASQYPDSDWAPRALQLQFFVQQNIPVYGSARQ